MSVTCHTTGMSALQPVDTFEDLVASGAVKDWRQVAQDCSKIASCWEHVEQLRASGASVFDRAGQRWRATEFWLHAKGLADSRAESSQPSDFTNGDRLGNAV